MPDAPPPSPGLPPPLPPDLPPAQVRPILRWPDPVLSARAEPVGVLAGPALAALIADLLATMYAAGGRGLAAPQIGVRRRAFVMDAGWKTRAPDPLVVLDPEIVARSEEVETAEERCLSIPDRPMPVTRPVSVTMAFFDRNGHARRRVLTGVAARIAQHEADHLDGRLIVDDPR